jgi:hypothetical protein
MIRRCSVAVVLTGALGLTLLSPLPASACSPGRPDDSVSRHVGWLHFHGPSSTTYTRAVHATIDEYHPFVGPINGFSNPYVMIRGQSGDILYYAQTGWTETWGLSAHHLFWEDGWVNVSTGQSWHEGSTSLPISPGAHTYTAVWYNAPGAGVHTFKFAVGSNYFAERQLTWSPSDGEISGETFGGNVQMPGDTSTKVNLKSSQAAVNGQWIAFFQAGNGPLYSGPSSLSWYGGSTVSTTWFSIWDKGCSS